MTKRYRCSASWESRWRSAVRRQCCRRNRPAPDRPNVVLIMTDDAGYGDFGVYGAPDIKTPHIDSLARDGVRLTDFYANGATCTPTRAGLITGRYQQRYGLEAPLGARPKEDCGARAAADRPLAAAAAEERRLRHGAGRQVAPRLEAASSARARTASTTSSASRAASSTTTSTPPAATRRCRPTCSRTIAPVEVAGLHDRPDHRSVRAVHRAERATAVLHRRRLQRAALAVPAARSAVDGARQRPAPRRPSTIRHEHARRLRRDGRAGRSRASAGSSRRSTGSDLRQQHDRHLHQRQRRRVAVAQRPAVPSQGHRCGRAASACRRSSAGPGAFRPAACPVRSGITMDLTASILAAAGVAGAGRRAAWTASNLLPDPRRTRAGDRADAVLAGHRRAASSRRSAADAGSWSSTRAAAALRSVAATSASAPT